MRNLNKWEVREEYDLRSSSESESYDNHEVDEFPQESPIGTAGTLEEDQSPPHNQQLQTTKSQYSEVDHDRINMNIKHLRRETYQTDDYSDGQFFEEQRERKLTEKRRATKYYNNEQQLMMMDIEPLRNPSRQPQFHQAHTDLPKSL